MSMALLSQPHPMYRPTHLSCRPITGLQVWIQIFSSLLVLNKPRLQTWFADLMSNILITITPSIVLNTYLSLNISFCAAARFISCKRCWKLFQVAHEDKKLDQQEIHKSQDGTWQNKPLPTPKQVGRIRLI